MKTVLSNMLQRAAAEAGWTNLYSGIRAVWTTPLEGEDGAPAHRIIHCRIFQMHEPIRLQRIGLQVAPGYHKCGSRPQIDWTTGFRLLVWNGKTWSVHRQEQNIPRPPGDDPLWFDLSGVTASGAIIELRSCEIDRWWTSWNLAQRGCLLDGEADAAPYPRRESRLAVTDVDLTGTPPGVKALRLPGEVRFRTPKFEVGFSLGRAGFSYLAVDDEGEGDTSVNLLRLSPAVALQGILCHPVGAPPAVAPLLRNDVTGTARVRGSNVTYTVALNGTGLQYVLAWNVTHDSLGFHLTRRGERDLRVWESSAWSIVCQSEVSPTSVLGHRSRRGESGLVPLPALFHAPGHGTFRISAAGDGLCRSDSNRPLTFTSLELKVGEVPQPEGDYHLPAGEHVLEGALTPFRNAVPLSPSAPAAVVRAVGRCSITSMTYRADTATLSNNGNSIHAPLCMDLWSSVATRIGPLMPGLHAIDLLRHSLERWLDGGPGYASGGMTVDGAVRSAEDEYIMTGTACLLGLAELIEHARNAHWVRLYAEPIRRQLALMRTRDIDGDGIVESTERHGISGGHQWSTNWYDAISFGWKDAFSNALLYRALALLAECLPSVGQANLARGLAEWSQSLKASYLPAFLNPATGWLAGWRCADNELHDYAFLAVNGAAVLSGVIDGEQARSSMQALWNEAARVGLPNPRLGLPGNLRPIPDCDMITLLHGRPMGYYLNGGLTHSQSCRFVGALTRVGMTAEADLLLNALCETLADCSAFGGCNSGIDWRYWDGGPCGYEGILTDQFGILATAIDRYGMRER